MECKILKLYDYGKGVKSHTRIVFFDVVDVAFVVHQVFVVMLFLGWVSFTDGVKTLGRVTGCC